MAAGNNHARIFQLNISSGGVPKRAIPSGTVTTEGLMGDAHHDTRNHGGPDAALCLYSLEGYIRLQDEGHPAYPGSLGENIVTVGLDFALMRPGDRLRLGREVEIELTRHTTPCVKIAGSFSDGHFERVLQRRHPGSSRFYARVTRAGELVPGDPVELLERALPVAETGSDGGAL